MDGRDDACKKVTGGSSRMVALLLVQFAVSAMLVACGGPTCTGNTREYNGQCLSGMAITYIECTKERGVDLTTKVGGKLGGTFKVVADASVEAAYEEQKRENTVVALQVVSDCLKIAETQADSAVDKSAAQESRNRADMIKQQVQETAHIEIAPSQAQVGESLSVSGRNFYPDETVAIYIHATLIKQEKADSQGAFSTTIIVPKDAPPPGFSTVVRASGETSVKSARVPFERLP
ncbi:hypothetical protein [Pseudarthrobacter sp. BIM B-2242]|uniref:hypothetical protein n=1 Tax=Pseudarthrobacter sp. BIM B-2242 TaxID=2772401 RepID=UPI00168AE1F5|nr:hypothetical protein [Pseudarthrobacter sp. BIM B-2242]QOD02654.1 hypothetical protein IDT60_15030 [Pseudarthrobacter sp. BIM B-2242]